jgi:hypothetical protein
MTLRWFGRSYAYLTNKPMRAVASDIAYSTLLMMGDYSRSSPSTLNAIHAAECCSHVRVRCRFWRSAPISRPAVLARQGGLADGLWPHLADITRWSLLGVMLTEMTANAHAYLVTLVAGPAGFALLAIGALLMRPVSLVLTALPDMERPVMARAIVAGDLNRAFRSVKEFRTAAGAVWLADAFALGRAVAVVSAAHPQEGL